MNFVNNNERNDGEFMKRVFFLVYLLVVCLILRQHTVHATEGGSSYYFPGTNAAFLSVVAPSPGFMRVNQMLFYNGKADKTVLGGAVHLNLEANGFYNYVGGAYTFEKPVLGSKLQIGMAVPLYGKVNTDATAVTN
ncbi:MAG: hypothetical protein H6Q65_1431 [Firmicutes bacterium]|nr:hypothetical protein [Bacillota bacterium]